jgi:hypothetical protein
VKSVVAVMEEVAAAQDACKITYSLKHKSMEVFSKFLIVSVKSFGECILREFPPFVTAVDLIVSYRLPL